MSQKSWLPEVPENLFQRIKAIRAQAESEGVKIWSMGIGQPTGPALLSAREAAASAVMSESESMHEYQDNGSPGVPDFAMRFVQAHNPGVEFDNANVAFLPIPGIKPMLGLIPLACGAHINDDLCVATHTSPGYGTSAVWAGYFGVNHYAIGATHEIGFHVLPDNIREGTNLIMCTYPHNPSAQVNTRDGWELLCRYCSDNGIRLFNDGAYAHLAHVPEACTLAEVAVNFPTLSWAEAYSASKLIGNGTGWRIGAIVGSADFVGDLAIIKGETDSGFVAPMATGVISTIEQDEEGIAGCRNQYAKRIEILKEILYGYDMELACEPGAGFFTLWHAPKRAFGQDIENAEVFNNLMIKNAGVLGVPFGPYIRYSVTAPLENDDFQTAVDVGFALAFC